MLTNKSVYPKCHLPICKGKRHGGGIIKRTLPVALLALALAVCIIPLTGAVNQDNIAKGNINEIKSQNQANVDVSAQTVKKAEVNAAKKYRKTTKTYAKKTYKKTYTRSKYKTTRAASRYRTVRGGAYTSGKGVGDCWTNSEHLYNQLVSSGQNARILQYRNSYVSNHRSVQVYKNGGWADYDYRGNGYSWGYHAQASKPGMKIIKSSI